MASLFRGGRKTAQLELNNELPHFDVLYIGRSQARAKMGRECTKGIVAELVQKSRSTPELQRVSLVITSKGLVVRELSETNSRETSIPIYDVTYGAADKAYRNVFSFVTNHNPGNDNGRQTSFDSSRPFVCHAFVCKDAAMARAMVVYLVRAFKVGFESWKRAEKSQELREKIRAGPGQHSIADGTLQKSSSSGSCSGGTLKQDRRSELNDLSPRRTVVTTTTIKTAPPFETSNHVDKVTKWLDKWLNVGEKRPSSSRSVSSDSDNEKEQIGMGFSRRMQEFSDPDTMNVEVDIDSELADPEVRSVLEEMAADQQTHKPDSDGSQGSQGSSPTSNIAPPNRVTKHTAESSAFLY